MYIETRKTESSKMKKKGGGLASARTYKSKHKNLKNAMEDLESDMFLRSIRIEVERINNIDVSCEVSDKTLTSCKKFLKEAFFASGLTNYGNDQIQFFHPNDTSMFIIQHFPDIFLKKPPISILTESGTTANYDEMILKENIQKSYAQNFGLKIVDVELEWEYLSDIYLPPAKLEELLAKEMKMKMLGIIEVEEINGNYQNTDVFDAFDPFDPFAVPNYLSYGYGDI